MGKQVVPSYPVHVSKALGSGTTVDECQSTEELAAAGLTELHRDLRRAGEAHGAYEELRKNILRRDKFADRRRGWGSNVFIGIRRTFLYLEYSKAIGATICVYDRAPSQKSWPG